MGYIKVFLDHRISDKDGKAIKTTIRRIVESDMAGADRLDTNLLFHALATKDGKLEHADSVFPFILDYSLLS